MNILSEEIRKIIYEDNVEAFKEIMETNPKSLMLKDKNHNTVLHLVCLYNTEKIFDIFYETLTPSRKNMFNKMKYTPFHYGVLSTDKIFKTFINDSQNASLNKCDDKEQYGGPSRRRYEPIFRLISKPEFKDRVKSFLDTRNSNSVNWEAWTIFAIRQKEEWAVDLGLENVEEKSFTNCMYAAIDSKSIKMIEKIYRKNPWIFEPTHGFSLLEQLISQNTFMEVVEELDIDLTTTRMPMENYDGVLQSIKRFIENDIAIEFIAKRSIKLSPNIIEVMVKSSMNNEFFFRTMKTYHKKYDEMFYQPFSKEFPMVVDPDLADLFLG